jgi:hypothetical protein
MELIFENLQKGGSQTGAGKRGGGQSGLTGAGSRGGGPSGLTAAGLTGASKKLSGRQMGQLASHHTKIHGAGWFGDFVDGFKDGFDSVSYTHLTLPTSP